MPKMRVRLTERRKRRTPQARPPCPPGSWGRGGRPPWRYFSPPSRPWADSAASWRTRSGRSTSNSLAADRVSARVRDDEDHLRVMDLVPHAYESMGFLQVAGMKVATTVQLWLTQSVSCSAAAALSDPLHRRSAAARS